MKYITDFFQFLMEYDFIILPCAALFVGVFCLTNFCKNVYRKQNKKLSAATRKICAFPHRTAQYVNALPPDYQRQWRAYVNSGARQPSAVFEFVPKRNRTKCVGLISVAAIASALYVGAYVFDVSRYEYLVFQVAFYLALTLVMIASKLLFAVRESKAKKIFARFVNELNRTVPAPQTKKESTVDAVKEIKKLQKCPPSDAVFERASQILHSKGLDENRTAEEQRKLNTALNGLLQSYTHSPAK